MGSKTLLGLASTLWLLGSAPDAGAHPFPADSTAPPPPGPSATLLSDAHDVLDASTAPEAAPAPESEAGEAYEPVPLLESPPLSASLPVSQAVSKRLFGIVPNYRAEQAVETYKPLTAAEKFHIARSDSFDWPNYFLLAGFAMQSQVAAGGLSHNGGIAGFGKFYARSLGDQIIGSYVTEAILPSLLHEDPRFFRLGSGPVRHRALYAASRIFVTRTNSGANRFNFSEVAGNSAVVAIASLYYPESLTPSEGLERYSLQLGNDAISNLLTEFWPDIKHHLRFRRPYLFFPH